MFCFKTIMGLLPNAQVRGVTLSDRLRRTPSTSQGVSARVQRRRWAFGNSSIIFVSSILLSSIAFSEEKITIVSQNEHDVLQLKTQHTTKTWRPQHKTRLSLIHSQRYEPYIWVKSDTPEHITVLTKGLAVAGTLPNNQSEIEFTHEDMGTVYAQLSFIEKINQWSFLIFPHHEDAEDKEPKDKTPKSLFALGNFDKKPILFWDGKFLNVLAFPFADEDEGYLFQYVVTQNAEGVVALIRHHD